MTDFQAYIASVTVIAVSGMWIVAGAARLVIDRALPQKREKDQ